MHECPALTVSQSGSDDLAYRFHALIRHTNDVILIHDDLSVRDNILHRFFVRLPHIHCDQLNVLLIGHPLEVVSHDRLIAIEDQVYNRSFLDIGDDAARFLEQV